ncbi:Bifunctional protein FolD protein [uncultured archaeon]|nr:Bifunctional protein FolD protein [uncultured archaeon]
MPAKLIDGKKMSEKMLDAAKKEVASLSHKPCLAIVLVGDDPASLLYTRKKHEACKKVGIESRNIHLPQTASEKEVIDTVHKLNNDNGVDGILVQVPMPNGINEDNVLAEVALEKDVDGFHPASFGKLALNLPGIVPCTPRGVIRMLKESGVSLPGKHAVVIGRSRIVGKPLALLLLNENCTVTVCHSKTKDVGALSRQADIVCVAVGRPKTLTGDMVKVGAIVIDAGTNREGEKLVGDVDFESVSKKASLITPVPGGVGPMTIAALVENTIHCCKERRGK